MYTRNFWKAVGERAVKTFAQALAAVIGVQGVSNVLEVDWSVALGTAALATLLSLLTSVVSTKVGGNDGPSLVGAEQITGRHRADTP